MRGPTTKVSCETCGQPYDWQMRPGTSRSDVNVLAGPYCAECRKNWWGNQLSEEEIKACKNVRRAPTTEVELMGKSVMPHHPAWWTHDDKAVDDAGHLYYFGLTNRRAPPYKKQRYVQAIIDIADDGTLAGVELIDDMPPPPLPKADE